MSKFGNLLSEMKKLNAKEQETSKDAGHTHLFEINVDGNGKTTKTIGDAPEHTHEIQEYEVMEANGHGHTLPEKKPKVNEKDTSEMIKNIINKDGGKVIKVDLFSNVLVIRASKDSKAQLDRFLQTGKKIGMIKNGRVEKMEGIYILSAVIDSSKSSKLKEGEG